MTALVPLLVFSDLDGTLMDHNTYEWRTAAPAMNAVRAAGGGIILASSKTAAEITGLRHDMALDDWPAIVENGAGTLAAGGDDAGQADDYTKIRAVLDDLPDSLRTPYTGFGDMSVADVVTATGLSPDGARLAKTRVYSEPGLWRGTATERTAFEAALAQHGITAREGGRFLTLSFGCKKSDQMTLIKAQYQPCHTMALGDAPNDIEMLEAADFGVIVANPDHAPLPPLQGEADGRIIRTDAPGPAGWNIVVLAHLARLNLNNRN